MVSRQDRGGILDLERRITVGSRMGTGRREARRFASLGWRCGRAAPNLLRLCRSYQRLRRTVAVCNLRLRGSDLDAWHYGECKVPASGGHSAVNGTTPATSVVVSLRSALGRYKSGDRKLSGRSTQDRDGFVKALPGL